MTNRKIEYWVIPPEADAEFAANMEEVLETYEKPYNSAIPVLCMDEQPVQLVKETKTPIEATLDHGKPVGPVDADNDGIAANLCHVVLFVHVHLGYAREDCGKHAFFGNGENLIGQDV